MLALGGCFGDIALYRRQSVTVVARKHHYIIALPRHTVVSMNNATLYQLIKLTWLDNRIALYDLLIIYLIIETCCNVLLIVDVRI